MTPAMICGGAALFGVLLVTAGSQPLTALLRLHRTETAWHPETELLWHDIQSLAWVLFCAVVPVIALAVLAGRLSGLRAAARAATPAGMPLVDALTDLPSRAVFREALVGKLAAGRMGGLLIMELEGFQAIRMSHGTVLADWLLRAFATRLRAKAPATAHATRLRGDEFAVLLLGMDCAAVMQEATHLHRALSVPFPLGGHNFTLSMSIGVALLPDHCDSFDSAMNAGLVALAAAKAAGGGTWRLFDAALGSAAKARAQLRTEFRAALSGGQLVPWYQPIVDLRLGTVVGFEVLARWDHPERGLLLPDNFIALAEEQNLCAELSWNLLRQVSVDARSWPPAWRFAFNASPGQLRELLTFAAGPAGNSPDLLPPPQIELELTETALIVDMELARRVVRAMHQRGTRVALDDFGTGYANFLHLREIPFDCIKIDRSFIKDMLTDSRTTACVAAMLSLGRSLGVQMTAEGVETEAAAAHLRDLGCDFGQGYYFSRPVPASEVGRFAAGPLMVAAPA
jgi:diguanylate cyclase (GGDEF)-like protein